MVNLVTIVILASLLFPAGFNFFTQKAVDYSYPETILTSSQGPKRIFNDSLGIKTTAKSVLVVDQATGQVLYDKNSGQVLPIASITKLMTALIFLENNPGWEQLVNLNQADQREGGMVYLLNGEQVNVKDLFYLSLVASSNEATAALARSTGLDNFVATMNQRAFELGMSQTYFNEPTGLDPNNVSTAQDLAKLLEVALAKPEIVQAVTSDEYVFKVTNNNRLVRALSTDKLLDSYVNFGNYQIVGGKTGYLDEAGYCLALAINKKDGPGLVVVLLGSASQVDRWQEAKGLIDWAFSNFVWPELADDEPS